MTTATQVRASNKELTESVWKQRIAIQDALTELTRSIIILGKEKCHISGLDPDVRITIQFDNTMFSDEEAERLRMLQEISAGILQKWEYRVRYYGEDEQTAREMTGETEKQRTRQTEFKVCSSSKKEHKSKRSQRLRPNARTKLPAERR